MSDDMHPDVAAVLRQAQQLQSLMDDQLDRMNAQTFTGTDESETVQVTLDGHHQLAGVVIEEGLLSLGVEEVQKRLNEALDSATAAATASLEADRDRIDAAVADITDGNR
ncbi:DNA-binding protein [Mycobacterium sp. 852002-51152_SCH6134967]|uniref:YbaB/EbfC family nucleoid-associated protein n=1 Tax=Mycobacterium sp. 852002-51152_SCH6134967 TaxID=1834096 RepID=UPI0007FE0886|nr:YbaB/EbfC family nucleoid-associated protein [Mycobacterium sp. 852002-51152_SCH6134967]OBF95935.1 DNA-binding protein [Mycobacterium sp. 852002-51152_SCH6134967]